jgi:hypothetical protein
VYQKPETIIKYELIPIEIPEEIIIIKEVKEIVEVEKIIEVIVERIIEV